jgi:hypothetical protein
MMRDSTAQLLLATLREVLEAHDDELKHGGQVYTDGDQIRAAIATADNEEHSKQMAQEAAMELRDDRIRANHLAGECTADGTRYQEGGPR